MRRLYHVVAIIFRNFCTRNLRACSVYFADHMATSMCCRICSGKAEHHYTALDSNENLKVDLPGRITHLLGVPIAKDDNHTKRVCRACLRKFTTLECSLKVLQQLAQATYEQFHKVQPNRKRPKETSGTIGVSPHTQRCRPPSKRIATNRCLFPMHDNTSSM